eukprot:5441578-Amphidinium_carterae.1
MLLARPDLFPLTQNKAHAALQHVEYSKLPPSKVTTWTTTLRWIQNIAGGEITMSLLLRKADAIRERMASTKAPIPHRDRPLSIPAVCALETACIHAPTWVHRSAAGHFRSLLGASARYDDGQHARADTPNIQEASIEFQGWQTKSMRVARPGSQLIPLICPLRHFGADTWWPHYVSASQQLQRLLPERDFLLPSPAPDFGSFQATPCNREQALPWLRQLLVLGGVDATAAQDISLASLRVLAQTWRIPWAFLEMLDAT